MVYLPSDVNLKRPVKRPTEFQRAKRSAEFQAVKRPTEFQRAKRSAEFQAAKESGGVPESKEAGGASGSKEAGGVSESKAVSEISEKDNIQEPERKPAADTEISRRPAAKFTLKELSGSRMVSLKDFRGKPVFIDFWASWCPPCRQATPYIKRIIEEFGDDLYIIGINLDRNKSDALNYIEEENINYMQLKGIGTDIPSKYEVRGIPTFYILDSEGGVVKTYSGFTNRYYREWETILKDLL